MSNVVPLRQPQTEVEPSTFESAWRMLPETMRKRSDSKAKCMALWDRTAKRLNGQEDLLARLRTYLRDDRDLPKSGGPGLQVLLRAGRLDHWTPTVQTPTVVIPFADDALRAAIVSKAGEAFARSYLDRCRIEGTTLVTATEFAVGKLLEHRAIFKAFGLTGIRKAR